MGSLDKECEITYYYYVSVSLWNAIHASFLDANGKCINTREILEGFWNAKDTSKVSLDDLSILKKISFMADLGKDICMKKIEIKCGANTGLGTSVRYTQIPIIYLEKALRTNNYTAKDQSYAEYENDHDCVYMYGDWELSNRLRGFEMDADIFECANESTIDEQIKCIGRNVRLYR